MKRLTGYFLSSGLTFAVALLLIGATPAMLSAMIVPNFVVACVAKDGTTRIVAATTTCRTTETTYQMPLLNRVVNVEGSVSSIESLDVTLQNQITTQQGAVTALQGVVSGQTTSIAALQSSMAALPASFTSYTNRAAFAVAAGGTTTIDFTALPAGGDFYASLALSGVTFNNFNANYQQSIYVNSSPIASIRIDLPQGTRAVGADLASYYGDPGLYTISLSTGQESTTTSGSGFLGVVSAKPLDWITIRFYSMCTPSQIYGVATCPGFLAGFTAGILIVDNVTFGPGI